MEILMTYTEIFEHLHRNPELSFEEFETTAFIKQILSSEGIEILDLPLKTGLVARVKGLLPGKKIAFRADIDALPITEQTNLPYKSQKDGKMHACGHDIHITTGIETARILQKQRETLHGEVLFVFQPAEEAGVGGADSILATNVLDGIDSIFSLHSSPILEVGEIGINEGAITAAVDMLKIKIKGTGSHGAQPQDGRDPIAASAAVISSLQSIVARNVSPFSQAVVSITHIEGGNSWNVIPSEVLLEGTVRTTTNDLRSFVNGRVRQIVENTAKAYGEEAEVEITAGPPATNNDKILAEKAWQMAEKLGFTPLHTQCTMVGEDFAYYQQKVKGIMVWLGVGKTAVLHNPAFVANPKAIEVGATFFGELLKSELEKSES